MKKILSIGSILFIMAFLSAGVSSAVENTASVHVRARLMPFAKHTIVHKESLFIVTPADIEKGYVDIKDAVILKISTNSRNGYVLGIFVDSSHLKGAALFDGNNIHTLSQSGGEIHMPYTAPSFKKELSLRVYLNSGVEPGVYNLPLGVMVNAV